MAKHSAGILVVRRRGDRQEFLLGHPGGPFYARREDAVWTVFKGLVEEGELPLDAARREFREETGWEGLPETEDAYRSLGCIRYRNGKVVSAWAVEADCDPATMVSNTITLEWPPRTGETLEVPEIDRHAFFPLEEALDKVHPAQQPFLRRAAELLPASGEPAGGGEVDDPNEETT